ncbi:MAG: hypothetical protein A2452_11070 [Candidatus Firestonebacteria bacterium RIFOXYC2_FULL_39_67]|nr:MAG: hypothetical protein A2452_11070 [Candidatus Firestonebacteria bacterium RIFOXYC2_FULL_39_67]
MEFQKGIKVDKKLSPRKKVKILLKIHPDNLKSIKEAAAMYNHDFDSWCEIVFLKGAEELRKWLKKEKKMKIK